MYRELASERHDAGGHSLVTSRNTITVLNEEHVDLQELNQKVPRLGQRPGPVPKSSRVKAAPVRRAERTQVGVHVLDCRPCSVILKEDQVRRVPYSVLHSMLDLCHEARFQEQSSRQPARGRERPRMGRLEPREAMLSDRRRDEGPRRSAKEREFGGENALGWPRCSACAPQLLLEEGARAECAWRRGARGARGGARGEGGGGDGEKTKIACACACEATRWPASTARGRAQARAAPLRAPSPQRRRGRPLAGRPGAISRPWSRGLGSSAVPYRAAADQRSREVRRRSPSARSAAGSRRSTTRPVLHPLHWLLSD